MNRCCRPPRRLLCPRSAATLGCCVNVKPRLCSSNRNVGVCVYHSSTGVVLKVQRLGVCVCTGRAEQINREWIHSLDPLSVASKGRAGGQPSPARRAWEGEPTHTTAHGQTPATQLNRSARSPQPVILPRSYFLQPGELRRLLCSGSAMRSDRLQTHMDHSGAAVPACGICGICGSTRNARPGLG